MGHTCWSGIVPYLHNSGEGVERDKGVIVRECMVFVYVGEWNKARHAQE